MTTAIQKKSMPRALWIIVICGGAILGISLGFRQTLGLFLEPISLELGKGRGAFALAIGLLNLVWGLGSPFAGAIADRYGPGRVAAMGGLIYALGLLVLALSGNNNHLLLGGVLIGAGLSGTGFSVILGTVGRAASPKNRSKALGIASMCGSIGQFAALPYTYSAIDGFGWMWALILLTCTTLLIIPLARGISDQSGVSPDEPKQSMKEALSEASHEKSFWLLNVGFFVCGFHLAFVGVHFPAYLSDKGFEPGLAATALTVIGLCNIVGVYVCGSLGEKYQKKNVLSVLYVMRALIFMIFLVLPISEMTVLFFAAFLGFLWLGTVPLTSGLVATMFGTRYMSMLFGIVFVGHQSGGFLGAWLAGIFYDLVGSYDAMWWASVALGLLSALLHWPISEQPVARQQQLVTN